MIDRIQENINNNFCSIVIFRHIEKLNKGEILFLRLKINGIKWIKFVFINCNLKIISISLKNGLKRNVKTLILER